MKIVKNDQNQLYSEFSELNTSLNPSEEHSLDEAAAPEWQREGPRLCGETSAHAPSSVSLKSWRAASRHPPEGMG